MYVLVRVLSFHSKISKWPNSCEKHHRVQHLLFANGHVIMKIDCIVRESHMLPYACVRVYVCVHVCNTTGTSCSFPRTYAVPPFLAGGKIYMYMCVSTCVYVWVCMRVCYIIVNPTLLSLPMYVVVEVLNVCMYVHIWCTCALHHGNLHSAEFANCVLRYS